MSVKARDIFQHAESFFDPKNCDEIVARMLINRAYYGIYGYVLSEVENRLFYDLDKSNPSVHQALINTFKYKKCSSVDQQRLVAKIATQLRQARLLRTNADYELQYHITHKDTEQALVLGKQIFEMIELLDV